MDDEIDLLQWGAIGLSFLSRLTFVALLLYNRSRKLMSCTVCGLNIAANICWLPYAMSIQNRPFVIRSAIDLVLSTWGVAYILFNRGWCQGARSTEEVFHPDP